MSPDAIRVALHGHVYAEPAEPMVWAIARIMVDSLFRAGHETVILDATSVTEQRRAAWETIFPTTWKVFRTSPAECTRRAYADGREDLEPIIARMWESWFVPEDLEDRPPSQPRA